MKFLWYVIKICHAIVVRFKFKVIRALKITVDVMVYIYSYSSQ